MSEEEVIQFVSACWNKFGEHTATLVSAEQADIELFLARLKDDLDELRGNNKTLQATIADQAAEIAKLKATLADRETEIKRLKEGIPKPAWSAHWRKRVERWVETIENVRKPSWPDGTPVRVKQMERELKHYLEFGLLQMKDTTEQSQWVSVKDLTIIEDERYLVFDPDQNHPSMIFRLMDGQFIKSVSEDCQAVLVTPPPAEVET